MNSRFVRVIVEFGVISAFCCNYVYAFEYSKTSDNEAENTLLSAKVQKSKFQCVYGEKEVLHNLQGSSVFVAPSQPELLLLKNSTVMVTWSIVKVPNVEILYFIIEYRKTMGKLEICKCKLWHKYSDDLPSKPYSYMLECLEPNYTYRIRVAAVYDEKNTIYSSPSRLIKLRLKDETTTQKVGRKVKRRRTTPVIYGNETETERYRPEMIEI